MPLRILGVWHLLCAVAGAMRVVPVLPSAVQHPAGWTTLALLLCTAVVGVALIFGKQRILTTAVFLQAAQVLALSLPGLAVWIVRVGPRVALSVPPIDGHGAFVVSLDATVFTILGAAARLPLGISINLCALIAFVACLTCLPSRAGKFRAGPV